MQKRFKDSVAQPVGSDPTRQRDKSRSIKVVVPELRNAYVIGVLDGMTLSAAAEGFEVVIDRVLSPELVG